MLEWLRAQDPPCPWENLGLDCPDGDRFHAREYAHGVCAYCGVRLHVLAHCPVALRDGVPRPPSHRNSRAWDTWV